MVQGQVGILESQERQLSQEFDVVQRVTGLQTEVINCWNGVIRALQDQVAKLQLMVLEMRRETQGG